MTNQPPPPSVTRYLDARTGASWRWDGRQWIPDGMPKMKSRGSQRRGWLAGLTFGTVLAALFAGVGLFAALAGGQEVRSVDPGSGRIEFYSTAGAANDQDPPDIEEIESSQGALAARVDALEQQAASQADQSTPSATADFSGLWLGANGLTYSIAQFGTEAVIEEQSPYGTTAVGEGSIVGDTFSFEFGTYDGSFGEGTLTMTSPGTLSGTFFNDFFGTSTPAAMERL